MARIVIPPEMLAFQLGQSAEIRTGGKLQATPHCVVKNPELAGKGVSRNTFALFMQPNFDEIMKVPEGISPERVTNKKKDENVPALKERWTNGDTFKKFHLTTIQHYS